MLVGVARSPLAADVIGLIALLAALIGMWLWEGRRPLSERALSDRRPAQLAKNIGVRAKSSAERVVPPYTHCPARR